VIKCVTILDDVDNDLTTMLSKLNSFCDFCVFSECVNFFNECDNFLYVNINAARELFITEHVLAVLFTRDATKASMNLPRFLPVQEKLPVTSPVLVRDLGCSLVVMRE
jgi:hypothetical protein